MQLQEEKQDHIMIVSIIGNVDADNYTDLEAKLQTYMDAGENRILLDCRQLNYISSAGLRVFIMVLKTMNALAGHLAICCLQENILDVFKISGFLELFTVYSSKEEAPKRQALEAKIIAKARQDDKFRRNLLKDPKGTLVKEFKIPVPDSIDLQVIEEKANKLFLVLPIDPGDLEVPDEALKKVAAGSICNCSQLCAEPYGY